MAGGGSPDVLFGCVCAALRTVGQKNVPFCQNVFLVIVANEPPPMAVPSKAPACGRPLIGRSSPPARHEPANWKDEESLQRSPCMRVVADLEFAPESHILR